MTRTLVAIISPKEVMMAKGQEKKGREKKKPKQNKLGQTGHQSEYAKSMAGKGTAPTPFGPKK